MDIAAESIASSLNLAVTKELHHYGENIHKNITTKPLRLPKMESPSKSHELFKRIYLTIAIYLTYFGMGLNSGVVGPTLVHLECLYHTNTAGISQVVMWTSLGYLLGSIICVALFDRINHEMQFAFWGILMAISTTFIPWMPNLYVYFAVSALQFMNHGVLYSGGQAFTLKLWASNSFRRPILQASHLMWSIGAFTCPFISVPFLVELNQNGTFCNRLTTNFTYNHSSILNSDMKNFELDGVFKIRYIYGILGIVQIIPALLFTAGCIIIGPKCTPYSYNIINLYPDQNQETSDQKQGKVFNDSDTKVVKLLKIAIFCVILLIVMLFFWHETVIGSYITAFTIKGLDWSSENGALVSSMFFGCHGLGRVAGVFISKLLVPSTVLLINMSFAIAGLTMLLFSYANDIILFIGTAVVGFFVATTFPSLLLWLSDYIPISGVMGGMFMAVASVGTMIIAPVVGYLFQNYTHMWVIYISLGSAVLCLIIFFGLIVMGRILSNYQKAINEDQKPQEKKYLTQDKV